jgi:hypothetical protein
VYYFLENGSLADFRLEKEPSSICSEKVLLSGKFQAIIFNLKLVLVWFLHTHHHEVGGRFQDEHPIKIRQVGESLFTPFLPILINPTKFFQSSLFY